MWWCQSVFVAPHMQSHITSTFGLVCSRMFMSDSHVASFSVNVWCVCVCVRASILRIPSHLYNHQDWSFRQYRQTNFRQWGIMFIDGIDYALQFWLPDDTRHVQQPPALGVFFAQDVDSSCRWCWQWAWPECTMASRKALPATPD